MICWRRVKFANTLMLAPQSIAMLPNGIFPLDVPDRLIAFPWFRTASLLFSEKVTAFDETISCSGSREGGPTIPKQKCRSFDLDFGA